MRHILLCLVVPFLASGCFIADAILGPSGPLDLEGTWKGSIKYAGEKCEFEVVFAASHAEETRGEIHFLKHYRGTWTWLRCPIAPIDQTGRSGDALGRVGEDEGGWSGDACCTRC